ncbi:hypothetical protein P7K49_026052 [Saguinus oedipus]|uniref:Uncharacterized protein n=1 Tax=Saguinus oedipus TaxID=9490 RepID=A0ABQ9UIY7_SAGOE|nr:hypothetical protein P7K49_026052 [Saguinus oedipus]
MRRKSPFLASAATAPDGFTAQPEFNSPSEDVTVENRSKKEVSETERKHHTLSHLKDRGFNAAPDEPST